MYFGSTSLLGRVAHTMEAFIYLAMETLTHAQRKKEGILDTQVLLQQLPIGKEKCIMSTKEELKGQTAKEPENHNIKTKIKEIKPNAIAEVNKIIEEDQIIVKSNI